MYVMLCTLTCLYSESGLVSATKQEGGEPHLSVTKVTN